MQEFLIKNYISRLTTNEIDEFAKKHGIELKENELILIKQIIQKDWRTIIYGNPKPILDNIKTKLSNLQYQKIENLYIEFKQKYENYL